MWGSPRRGSTAAMQVSLSRVLPASPDAVWQVLADGWTYADWVVGTSKIRAVDEAWPAPGSRLQHAVGAWPLLVEDETRVLDADTGRRLLLRARGWPLGEADVDLLLAPVGEDGTATRVTLHETLVAGPGRVVMTNPAGAALLRARNTETLSRLAAIAERRRPPTRP